MFRERGNFVGRGKNTLRHLAFAVVFLSSVCAYAQQFPLSVTSSVEPIKLTLTAPGDGQVIEILAPDHMTAYRQKDPLSSLSKTYHPFPVARISVGAVEEQLAKLEAQLRDIEGALSVAGYEYADMSPDYFALTSPQPLNLESADEAAWRVLRQDKVVAEDLFNANLIDPWGSNEPDPMRLEALDKATSLRTALAAAKRNLDGREVATNAQLALSLAYFSLRIVREQLGLEDMRVSPSSHYVEPVLPNSNHLMLGSKVTLQIDFNGGLDSCDILSSYWRDVEGRGLWTASDAAFARRVAGQNWSKTAELPFVTHSGETIPLISEELERECDEARENLIDLKVLREMAAIGVASINIAQGLQYNPLYYSEELEQLSFDLGIKRNAEKFAFELAPSRLIELVRQSSPTKRTGFQADAQRVVSKLLETLERLKWDNFKFRGGRALSQAEIAAFATALETQTVASLGSLRYRGRLLHVDEKMLPVFTTDLVPNGYDGDTNLTDYYRAFQAIDSKLGFSLLRLNSDARPLDIRIAAVGDARPLVREAEIEKRRLAVALHSEWQRIANDRETVRRDYDSGRIWAKEPIRSTFSLVRKDESVKLGQPLLIAEPTSRFRVTLPSQPALALLPIGSQLSVKLDAHGLPPLPQSIRQTVLSTTDPAQTAGRLSQIYQDSTKRINATGSIVSQDDKSVKIEIQMPEEITGLNARSADESSFLSNLGFECDAVGEGGTGSCAFPLGMIGAESTVSLVMQPADPRDTEMIAAKSALARLVSR